VTGLPDRVTCVVVTPGTWLATHVSRMIGTSVAAVTPETRNPMIDRSTLPDAS